MVFVRRTRAIFRRAEFGFFGVMVRTCTHTPRFCGDPLLHSVRLWSALYRQRSAGAFVFFIGCARPRRTSWFIVGNLCSLYTRVLTPATTNQHNSRYSLNARGLRPTAKGRKPYF